MTGCEQCYNRLQQRDWLRAVLQCNVTGCEHCEQCYSRLQQRDWLRAVLAATVDYSNVTGCEQCYNRLQQRDWLRAVSQSITAM